MANSSCRADAGLRGARAGARQALETAELERLADGRGLPVGDDPGGDAGAEPATAAELSAEEQARWRAGHRRSLDLLGYGSSSTVASSGCHRPERIRPTMTRTLVTGAAGFVGAGLARRLLDAVRCRSAAVRPGSDRWRLDRLEEALEVVEVDLATPMRWQALVAFPDAVASSISPRTAPTRANATCRGSFRDEPDLDRRPCSTPVSRWGRGVRALRPPPNTG